MLARKSLLFVVFCALPCISPAEQHVRPEISIRKGALCAVRNNGNYLDVRRKLDGTDIAGDEIPLITKIDPSIGTLKRLEQIDFQGHAIASVPRKLASCTNITLLGFPNQKCPFMPSEQDMFELGDILGSLTKLNVLALDCTAFNTHLLDEIFEKKLTQNLGNFFFSVSGSVSPENPVRFFMPSLLARPELGCLSFCGIVGVRDGFEPYCLPYQVAIDVRCALVNRPEGAQNLQVRLPYQCDKSEAEHEVLWEEMRQDLLKIYASRELYKCLCGGWSQVPTDVVRELVLPYLDECGGKPLPELVKDFEQKYALQVTL